MPERIIRTEQIGRDRFTRIQNVVQTQASALFKHGTVAQEMTNNIMLGLVTEHVDDNELQDWAQGKVEALTEFYVADLWQYAYRYALILTEDEDAAQDVTQNAMTALLKSKAPISFVKGWLKSTVFKQSMQYLKQSYRERDFSRILEQQPGDLDPTPAFDETEIENEISTEEMKKYLKRSDYTELMNMMSRSSLKEYAQKTGQSYATVRKAKHRLLRDLKANYLKAQGWLDTPAILSYRIHSNIRRFMQALVDHVQAADVSSIYRYCPKELAPDVEATFSIVKEISDWGITQLGTNAYEVSIIDAVSNENPVLAVIEIKITRGNYIHITKCVPTELMAVLDEGEYGPIPLEKGAFLWEIEDIKRMMA